jgi:hypothetical protein
MNQGQLHTILTAIKDTRHELAERIEAVDARLRSVELYQASTTSAQKTREKLEDAQSLTIQWKVGIVVSVLGTLLALAASMTGGN